MRFPHSIISTLLGAPLASALFTAPLPPRTVITATSPNITTITTTIQIRPVLIPHPILTTIHLPHPLFSMASTTVKTAHLAPTVEPPFVNMSSLPPFVLGEAPVTAAAPLDTVTKKGPAISIPGFTTVTVDKREVERGGGDSHRGGGGGWPCPEDGPAM